MQQPDFWHRPAGVRSALLAPLALIWAKMTARRIASVEPVKIGIPVICIGNLTLGGTGKTPTVCALAQRLQAKGRIVHLLSRGYRGEMSGPVLVDLEKHTAKDVGDEPLLLAGFAPVWVSKDRVAGAQAAAQAGADVIIMDDGFQNPKLAKDLSLVVVDGITKFGNGKVVPAGPLREPVRVGLKRADLILSIGGPLEREKNWPDIPLVTGYLQQLETGMDWQGLNVVAFAGIGRPEKFFLSLKNAGANIVQTRSFPDHATYPRPLVERMISEAKTKQAQLVTTEKDAVRLPADLRRQIIVFPVRLQLEDWQPVDDALARIGLS